MPAAGVVLIIVVVLLVGVMAAFLLPTIVALSQTSKSLNRAIAAVGELLEKTEPVDPVVSDINANLDAAVDALEGLLVKKAGLSDSMGLIDSVYPGAASAGLRNYPDSGALIPPRIGEVYTRGTLTLARLGREAPVAAASPDGPILRHIARSEIATDRLYTDYRQTRPETLPRSPVIGSNAPTQYEPTDTPGVRLRMPSGTVAGTAAEETADRGGATATLGEEAATDSADGAPNENGGQ